MGIVKCISTFNYLIDNKIKRRSTLESEKYVHITTSNLNLF